MIRNEAHEDKQGHRRPKRAIAAGAALLLIAVMGCSDDSSTSPSEDKTEDTVAGETAANLLGPDDVASGDPIKIGLVSDGSTESFDNTDELRAGQAMADYYNQHQGGVAGRPVELVTCETNADPAGAAGCANTFITEDVVAVALSQSGVANDLWKPLKAEGIPTFFTQTNGEEMEADPTTSFMVLNPNATFFGLPVAVADSMNTKKIAYVVIDVPQAVDLFKGAGAAKVEAAGYESTLIQVPIGTADMTTQMQQVVNSGAGVVQVVGNDAFCIAAFKGLEAVGFEGGITAVNQCVTDATREAMPGELEGINVLSSLALGAVDDPSYELYKAVMTEYGPDVRDVDNFIAMGGYAAVGSLLAAMQDLTGDVTPETAATAIKSMPESPYPGGGGILFKCGGSAVPTSPAICTNQWLRAELDANGNATTYEVEDSVALFGT